MILCRCLNCAFRGHSALKIDFEHIIGRCNKLKSKLCKCWLFVTQWCYIYMKKSWNSLSQQRKNELPLQNHPHRFQPCCDLFVCRWRILTSSRTIALKHPQFQRGQELVWLHGGKVALKNTKTPAEPVRQKLWIHSFSHPCCSLFLYACQVHACYCYFHHWCVLSCAAVCSPVSVVCSELVELRLCGVSLHSELLSDLFLTSVFGRCVEPQGPFFWACDVAIIAGSVCLRVRTLFVQNNREGLPPPPPWDESYLSSV